MSGQLKLAIVAGVALGVCYSLSPLTVICVPLILALTFWVARDLDADERRWFYTIVAVAMTARLLAISVLFLSADSNHPFEVLFGDELFFKNRSLWIRNIGLDVPISPADVIYAYEDVGISSYLYALALIQALVGKTPYGIHVLNSACYLTGALLMFRLIRRSFGAVASFAGLCVLLFTPTLFLWSISALKEPAYALAACTEIICAVQAARSATWRGRIAWLAGVVVSAIALDSLRRGGGLVALAGIAGGYLFGYVLPRPRLLLATVALLPVIAIAAWNVPQVQNRVLGGLRTGASYHAGHVLSNGYSYQALRGEYYREGLRIPTMPVRDVVSFVMRSFVAYVTEPVPWRTESRALLAYFPEQMFWYVLLALAIVGVAGGVARDAMLTALLTAHAFGAAAIVAISAGNIGTLIRHRGLIMPYLVWLSGFGLYHVVKIAVTHHAVPAPGGLQAHGRV